MKNDSHLNNKVPKIISSGSHESNPSHQTSRISSSHQLPTVEEYISEAQSPRVRINCLKKSSHVKKNKREIRNEIVTGRCVMKTTFNYSQFPSWSNDFKKTEFWRVVLIDNDGVESQVRFSVFNKNAIRLFHQIKLNRVYAIHNFEIIEADRKYISLPNPYEASFHATTSITELQDDHRFPTKLLYSCTSIADILKITSDACIDLEGIVINHTDIRMETNWKTKESYEVLDVALMDKSCHSIQLKLTGQWARKFSSSLHSVYRIHAVTVRVFGSLADPVPQRRLVKVMRCSNHDDGSVTTPSPTPPPTDDDRIWDFDDDDEDSIIIICDTAGDNNYDEVQILTEKTDEDDDKEESLLDWWTRIGQFVSPTPIKVLKYAERAIAKYEEAKKYFDEIAQIEGEYGAQRKAAQKARVDEGGFAEYLKRFRNSRPKRPSAPWKYDEAITFIRQQFKENPSVKVERQALAKKLGINLGQLSMKCKEVGLSIQEQKNTENIAALNKQKQKKEEGVTVTRTYIAKKLGKSATAISIAAKKHGFAMRVTSRQGDYSRYETARARLIQLSNDMKKKISFRSFCAREDVNVDNSNLSKYIKYTNPLPRWDTINKCYM